MAPHVEFFTVARETVRDMCGRAACSLNPATVSCACDYKDASGKRRSTSWTKSDVQYIPSQNIGPKDALPCITAGSHFGDDAERVLCAMMWSMIPPWHEGHYKKSTMSTHNARLENLKSSTLYGPPLRRGQRCVVVCEGYYEWKGDKTKGPKQPYYIYAAQEKGVRVDDPTTWTDGWSEDSGWTGAKVLKMAGLFNKFKTPEGKTVYSCTIITTDSNAALSWMHNRMPVLLSTEEDTHVWLNKELSVAEAVDELNKLKLSDCGLSWHTVSTRVNSVFYKGEDCRKEAKAAEKKKGNPNSFMASWLKKGAAESAKRRNTNTDVDHSDESGKSDKTPLKVAKK